MRVGVYVQRRSRAHRGVWPLIAVIAAAAASGCGSSGAAGSSNELEDASGSKYRITITSDDPKSIASPGGCYAAPPSGRTSQQFTVTIGNLTADRAVPAPEIFFGTNLNDDGTRVLDVTTVENAYGLVEAFSPDVPTNCAFSIDFAPRGATVAANSKMVVVVTVVAMVDPPPPGMTLLTRVFLPDGTAHDLITPA